MAWVFFRPPRQYRTFPFLPYKSQVNLSECISFVELSLAILQGTEFLSAPPVERFEGQIILTYIQTQDRKHVNLYAFKDPLAQFLFPNLRPMTGKIIRNFCVSAIEQLFSFTGHGMIAISAKKPSHMTDNPCAVYLGLELTPYSVGLLIQLHAHDCRVMIRILIHSLSSFRRERIAADLFDGAYRSHGFPHIARRSRYI